MNDKVTQFREGNINFDLTVTNDLPELFTDGLSNLVMGNPVSKLTLHSVVAPLINDANVEQRKAILLLTIPTPVLLEMCRNILFAAQTNIVSLSKAGSLIDTQVEAIMSGVSIKTSTIDEAIKMRH